MFVILDESSMDGNGVGDRCVAVGVGELDLDPGSVIVDPQFDACPPGTYRHAPPTLT